MANERSEKAREELLKGFKVGDAGNDPLGYYYYYYYGAPVNVPKEIAESTESPER